MSTFNAGSLVWKIQTVGAEIFRRDQKSAQEAFDKTGDAAQQASTKINASGDATDKASGKAKNAKESLKDQADATKKSGDESASAKPKIEQNAKALEQQSQAAQRLGTALTIAGVAIGALVTMAVVKYADFDQAMSNVAAATMATTAEQDQLAESAMEAGAVTAYSAREAADAQEELAKAGLEVTEIVGGGLNGALSLAAAGQLAVARSAEVMATTLKQFKLPAEQAGHVSDVLAAGAGKAQGSVEDLAGALKYAGPVADGLGMSLEETAGTLALFASKGILGEQAGTSLRGVLMSLTAPSVKASETMEEYGINIWDSSGKMKSMAEISEIMRDKLGGLDEKTRSAAMGQIFGNEQITAARILYEGGADAVTEWTEKVNDSGYAAEQAAMRQDNLAGDIEKLGGAFDTALIQQGSAANDVLRNMVQGLTGLIDGFSDAEPGVQSFVGLVAIGTTTMLLMAGGALNARAKFMELKATLSTVNGAFKTTAIVGAAAGLALTGIITVVGALMAAQAEAEERSRSYAESLSDTGKATEETFSMIADKMLEAQDGWDYAFSDRWLSGADAAEKLGMSVNDVVRIVGEGGPKFTELSKKVEDLANNTNGTADALANELGVSTQEVTDAAYNLLPVLEEESTRLAEGGDMASAKAGAMVGLASETEAATEVTRTAAEAYLDEAAASQELNDQLSKLVDQLFEMNGVGQEAITTSNRYKETMAEVDEVIRQATEGIDANEDGLADHILTLDTNTAAGRANMDMLVGMAQDSQRAAAAQFDLDQDTAGLSQRLAEGRQKLYDSAAAMGYSATEANNLANQIYGIPSQKAVDIITNTASAQQSVDSFVNRNSGRRIYVYVSASGATEYQGAGLDVRWNADGGHTEFYAGGGHRAENHVAQMARAGTIRVWNEPETEGETYIPWAKSKRERSTQILSETADMFGYELVPKGATRFADGGSRGVVNASAVPPAPQGGNQVVFVNPTTKDPVADAWEAVNVLSEGL